MSKNIHDFDRWRQCWTEYLLGKHWNPDTEDGRQVIASMERIANAEQAILVPHEPLRALAFCYRTPGSRYYADSAVKEEILQKLDALYESAYNPGSKEEGFTEWWRYEIGIPLRLLDILFLLYDELPDREETIRKHTDAVLTFKDAYSASSHGKAETGANLMWKCHVMLLTGILRRDVALVDWVNGQLPTMLHYTHRMNYPGLGKMCDDGFYRDGSFVQHYMFAYTGGYGKHFLNILCGLLTAFDGQDCLRLDEEERQFFYDRIQDTYAPLVWGGRFMDLARGRETTRPCFSDKVCGIRITRSLCLLAGVMPQKERERLVPLLKQWLASGGFAGELFRDEELNQEYFVTPAMPEAVNAVLADPLPAAPMETAHYNLGVVSKVVHRRAGYALAVSMYSKQIACYERLGNQGLRSWHMADGMTYLYNADYDQYNGDYYATADMQRLPGTTVVRVPDPDSLPYYSWYLPESRSECAFAGGVTLGVYGSAGQHYHGQGRDKSRPLDVRKSWFMFDKEIVCMGSGITCGTEDPVETILDNRRLSQAADERLTLEGEDFFCAGRMDSQWESGSRWVHFAGGNDNIGYVVDGGEELHIALQHRADRWPGVNTGLSAGRVCENDHLTIWLNHGSKPQDASYCYTLLPGASAEATAAYAGAPVVTVLENTGAAHAVYHEALGITGIHFWQAGESAGFACDGEACLLVRKEGDTVTLALSDPTGADKMLTLTTPYIAEEVLSCDAAVSVQDTAPLVLRADTAELDGGTLNITVRVK